jgi:Tfp pilus assembly protein PilE
MHLPDQNYKQFFLKILETINFRDDKDAFIDQFTKNTYFQSIIDLIQSLPVDQQEEVKQKLTIAGNSAEKVEEALGKHFTQDRRSKAFEEASKNAMIGYFEAIDTTLSATQKQNLSQLFQEFK